MKNQYFGDRRDFFKYDLALTLIEQIDSLKVFTFIPMLTESDASNDGNVTQYDGSRRRDLNIFLRDCLQTSNRNIVNLRAFMANQTDLVYYPYKDSEFFTNQSRRKYFDQVEPSTLRDALILFDPDNGFEIKSMNSGNGHKYLKFEELSKIFIKAANSLILVYQHIPRVQRKPFFQLTAEKIRKHVTIEKCICVSDNEIVFFIIAQNDELLARAWDTAEKYSNLYRYHAYIL